MQPPPASCMQSETESLRIETRLLPQQCPCIHHCRLPMRAPGLIGTKGLNCPPFVPQVAHCQAFEGFEEDQVLRLAACVERESSHPLAAAIVGAGGGPWAAPGLCMRVQRQHPGAGAPGGLVVLD